MNIAITFTDQNPDGGALSWLNTSNTEKNILHAKDSINMALKELEDD